jgi:hypothetical protein
MADDTLLKAVLQGYEPAAFYFRQSHPGGDERWVSWTPSLKMLKDTVYAILESFPDDVDVLWKHYDSEDAEGQPEWIRFCGTVAKSELIDSIRRYESFVFQDASNCLCVRRLDTDEYFALDHKGPLYIYSDSDWVPQLLARLGYENRIEKLITEGGHWSRTFPDNAETRSAIAARLHLEQV